MVRVNTFPHLLHLGQYRYRIARLPGHGTSGIITYFIFSSDPFGAFAQYGDPNLPKPASGYGANGPHQGALISFDNPHFPGKEIEVYYPGDIAGPIPTIFYDHGCGGNFLSPVSGLR